MLLVNASSARLAQSVEHRTLNPGVVGSSPTLGALFFFSHMPLATNVGSFAEEKNEKTGIGKYVTIILQSDINQNHIPQ